MEQSVSLFEQENSWYPSHTKREHVYGERIRVVGLVGGDVGGMDGFDFEILGGVKGQSGKEG